MSTPPAVTARATALLRRLGAANIEYPGGTLLAHLQGSSNSSPPGAPALPCNSRACATPSMAPTDSPPHYSPATAAESWPR